MIREKLKEEAKKSLEEIIENTLYKRSVEWVNKDWEYIKVEMERYPNFQIEVFFACFLAIVLPLLDLFKKYIGELPPISEEDFRAWWLEPTKILQWKERILVEGVINLPGLRSVIKEMIDEWTTEEEWEKILKKVMF